MGDGDGEAEDGVLGVWVVDGNVAVEEALARDNVLLEYFKLKQARLALWGRVHGDDAAWRGLCYNLGA